MALSQASPTTTRFPDGPTPASPATSSTSAAVSTHPSSPTSGTSAGAVAGIAIGCFIAGAFLGFAVAFCVFRRRSQKHNRRYMAPVLAETKPPPPPPTHAPVQDRFHLKHFLLDSVPDKELAAELHALGSLIQQHVENNYRLGPVQADTRTLVVSLVQLGVGNAGRLTPEAIAALALEPSTRQVALQHVISQVVFASIDFGSRSQLSMLPAPVASFLQSVPPEDNGESNTEVMSYALNKWRMLTAFLLHPSRSQRTPLPAHSSAVAHQAAALATALDAFLGQFAPADEAGRFQQNSHLQAVIAECTKLGYVLLSQPSEWRFVHVPPRQSGGGRRTATVCAGLLKVTHKDGTAYGTPQEVVAPIFVQL